MHVCNRTAKPLSLKSFTPQLFQPLLPLLEIYFSLLLKQGNLAVKISHLSSLPPTPFRISSIFPKES